MWRPEGYTIPKLENGIYTAKQMEDYGEARADAMLEVLKEGAVTLSIADQEIDVPGFHIVFIPKED